MNFREWLLLNEAVINKFVFSNLNPQEKSKLYQIYKSSYEKIGDARGEGLFLSKAENMEFYGNISEDERLSGFLGIKRQNGLTRLALAAGNPLIIARAAKQLAQENSPIWGTVSEELVRQLNKIGFIEPPVETTEKALNAMQIKGVDKINDNGSILMNIEGIGFISKHFVANQSYLNWLNKYAPRYKYPLVLSQPISK